MKQSKYAIREELSNMSRFTLPLFLMTRTGSSLYNMIADLSCLFIKTPNDLKSTKHIISGYQSEKIKVVIYEPACNMDDLPCLVYFHGGGFALNATSSNHNRAMTYARGAQCKVVFVNYRTSSHHKYPTSLEDCYESVKWIYNNTEKLGINLSKIAVGGDSAGGALAASVTQMLRDRDRIKPKYQFLIYPVTDNKLETNSMMEYIDTPIWNAKLSKKMWQYYLRQTDSCKQMYSAPLNCDNFHELPDAYIEVSEFDSLRDEGILYANKLKDAGIDVELNEVKGVFHGFDFFKNKPIAKEVLQVRIATLIEKFRSQ